MYKLKKYAINILIAIDQLANAIFGGDPDETISSRLAKNTCNISKLGCKILGMLDKGHCAKSVESDEGKDGII